MTAKHTSYTMSYEGMSKGDEYSVSSRRKDGSTPSSKSSPAPLAVGQLPSDRLDETNLKSTHQRFVLTDPVAFR